MSSSFTTSESTSFTVTHARKLAAKVATDLRRMQRFYGQPSLSDIVDYEEEATQLLKAGYLKEVSYGFKKDGDWIEPTVKYTARTLGSLSANDDDPGRVRPGKDISGASFHSFLSYTAAWYKLDKSERDAFKSNLPHQRTSGTEPSVNGYFHGDKTYSSGGRALDRSSVRSY